MTLVSRVELASTALMMLSNGWKFDVVMTNVHSPELLTMKLLDEAAKMNILVICEYHKLFNIHFLFFQRITVKMKIPMMYECH